MSRKTLCSVGWGLYEAYSDLCSKHEDFYENEEVAQAYDEYCDHCISCDECNMIPK